MSISFPSNIIEMKEIYSKYLQFSPTIHNLTGVILVLEHREFWNHPSIGIQVRSVILGRQTSNSSYSSTKCSNFKTGTADLFWDVFVRFSVANTIYYLAAWVEREVWFGDTVVLKAVENLTKTSQTRSMYYWVCSSSDLSTQFKFWV